MSKPKRKNSRPTLGVGQSRVSRIPFLDDQQNNSVDGAQIILTSRRGITLEKSKFDCGRLSPQNERIYLRQLVRSAAKPIEARVSEEADLARARLKSFGLPSEPDAPDGFAYYFGVHGDWRCAPEGLPPKDFCWRTWSTSIDAYLRETSDDGALDDAALNIEIIRRATAILDPRSEWKSDIRNAIELGRVLERLDLIITQDSDPRQRKGGNKRLQWAELLADNLVAKYPQVQFNEAWNKIDDESICHGASEVRLSKDLVVDIERNGQTLRVLHDAVAPEEIKLHRLLKTISKKTFREYWAEAKHRAPS